MSSLVFLDTETTGLDPDLHEIWEIAWAINDEPIESRILPHSLQTADPKALEMNGYWDRSPWAMVPKIGEDYDIHLKMVLDGNTLVGSNPAFDAAFLRIRWGIAPWHYRMIDIESMALTVFGWDRPRGLKDIAVELNSLDFNVPSPNHSAAGDVMTLRESYKALRTIQRETKLYA